MTANMRSMSLNLIAFKMTPGCFPSSRFRAAYTLISGSLWRALIAPCESSALIWVSPILDTVAAPWMLVPEVRAKGATPA